MDEPPIRIGRRARLVDFGHAYVDSVTVFDPPPSSIVHLGRVFVRYAQAVPAGVAEDLIYREEPL